ncbi:MAG: HU family DNA-binding protein [Acidobacteria bacterium]|nr:HU family DNA-binding protein [Acidobacteriota bacterium]
MNRSEFLNKVADRAKAHRRDVEHVWEHAVAVIADEVKKGGKKGLSLPGFGKFKQRITAARKAGLRKDPFSGEMRQFPARPEKRVPRFVPAKPFKDFVSGAVRALPSRATRPMALGAPAAKAPAKKAVAKKAVKKAAPKKAVKKAAPKKAVKKGAKKR